MTVTGYGVTTVCSSVFRLFVESVARSSGALVAHELSSTLESAGHTGRQKMPRQNSYRSFLLFGS